jgi:hypothetical protein
MWPSYSASVDGYGREETTEGSLGLGGGFVHGIHRGGVGVGSRGIGGRVGRDFITQPSVTVEVGGPTVHTRQRSRCWVQELEVLGAEMAGAKIPGARTGSTAIKDGGWVSQSAK